MRSIIINDISIDRKSMMIIKSCNIIKFSLNIRGLTEIKISKKQKKNILKGGLQADIRRKVIQGL